MVMIEESITAAAPAAGQAVSSEANPEGPKLDLRGA